MNNSHQETSLDIQEEERGARETSSKRIIYFSSGETLEEEDSEEEEEEEEESSNRPFREPAKTTRFSFKSVAILVGRISLLTCDFLGERLAGALGLTAAKYQYAIDQYHQDHKVTPEQARRHKAKAACRRDRPRGPTSLLDRMGGCTEPQEMQEALLIHGEMKDVTTEDIKQMRIIWMEKKLERMKAEEGGL